MTIAKLQSLAELFVGSIDMYQSAIRSGVELRSPFRQDLERIRRGYSPYEQGSVLLSNSLDAAHVLVVMWLQGLPHSPTDYALMRVAIDNALRSAWLTSPRDQEVRLHRAWRIAIDSPFRAKRAAEAALRRSNLSEIDRAMYLKTGEDTKAVLRDIDRSFVEAGVDIARHSSVEMAEILDDGELEEWVTEIHIRRLWSLLSALVHGQLREVQSFSLTRADPDDERIRLQDPDPEMLASVGSSVNMIVATAVYGYIHKMSSDPARAAANVYSLAAVRNRAS